MKLTLKIYKENSKEIEKTYTAETIDFSFGVVEDIINVFKFDEIKNQNDLALNIIKNIDVLKPFLRDIFEGLTDEECRRTRVQNLKEVFTGLYRYAVIELGGAAENGKN